LRSCLPGALGPTGRYYLITNAQFHVNSLSEANYAFASIEEPVEELTMNAVDSLLQ
jgi:hypothetical protein